MNFRKLEEEDLKELQDLKYESAEFMNGFFCSNLLDQSKWFESMSSDNIMLKWCDGEKILGFYFIKSIDNISRHHDFTYYLKKEHRGRSLGKKFLKECISYSFNNLNINKIYGTVLSNNKKSINVMNSVGFKNVGLMKNHVFKNGSYLDNIILEIHRDE
tara:strand:+ start:1383 stop:1859 length:477 start_codon:yes stop_codon:yes gene_type:complete